MIRTVNIKVANEVLSEDFSQGGLDGLKRGLYIHSVPKANHPIKVKVTTRICPLVSFPLAADLVELSVKATTSLMSKLSGVVHKHFTRKRTS